MNQPKVYRFLNTVMVIDNGVRKIISEEDAVKSDNEILKSYNTAKKVGVENAKHDNT